MRIYEKKTVAGVLCTATALRVNPAQVIGWRRFSPHSGRQFQGPPVFILGPGIV